MLHSHVTCYGYKNGFEIGPNKQEDCISPWRTIGADLPGSS